MKSFLEKVRTPELNIPRQREPAITIGLVLAGFALEMLLSIVAAILYQLLIPHWG